MEPKKKSSLTILGLPLPLYLIVFALMIAAIAFNILPNGLIGALLFMMVTGALLDLIGNHTPIISTFFGGGPMVIIFGMAALAYFKVIPAPVIKNVDTFMKGGEFLNWYIAALIVGSILGMNRKLLIKAALRYIPTIAAGVAMALLLVSLGGLMFSQSPAESIAYIGIPIMGGGMGAGAVPIADVFAGAMGLKKEVILSRLVPAVALGNAMAIVAAGVLHRIGQKRPSLTGNGKLMEVGDDGFHLADEKEEKGPSLADYGIGLVLSASFYVLGNLIGFGLKKVGLNIHPYAWMIISVAIIKALDLMPRHLAKACANWYQFVAKNFTSALLVGIALAYTDMKMIIEAFSPQYVVLCFLVIVGAVLGTALAGKALGMYPIESALTAGLCMANMGGTGDVAVLTAAKRMELMPFAQISSRLGGALIILLASILIPIFF
ncbi:L-malate or citrate/H+ symporter CimH [Clostridiaceae bacterium JG1575]|nr:L-malate or citrate/H+ symporter CimH [Clostridiaceae bacterium JG1575]